MIEKEECSEMNKNHPDIFDEFFRSIEYISMGKGMSYYNKGADMELNSDAPTKKIEEEEEEEDEEEDELGQMPSQTSYLDGFGNSSRINNTNSETLFKNSVLHDLAKEALVNGSSEETKKKKRNQRRKNKRRKKKNGEENGEGGSGQLNASPVLDKETEEFMRNVERQDRRARLRKQIQTKRKGRTGGSNPMDILREHGDTDLSEVAEGVRGSLEKTSKGISSRKISRMMNKR